MNQSDDFHYSPEHNPHRRAEDRENRDEKKSDKDEPKKDSPENGKQDDKKDGDKKPKKMSKKKKRLLILGAIIVVPLLILAGLLYYLHARHFEDTDDAFIEGHISQMSSQVSGRVQTLLIDDNQQVTAGQLLLEIDSRDFEVRLIQAQAQREQAAAQIALQHASIGQAEANMREAEANLTQAQRDLARFRAVDPKAITKQQLDTAVANAKTARAKYDASVQSVEAAKAQETAAHATLQQSEADIRNAELQLSYTKIVAPVAGRITKRTVEVGNVVATGQPLLAIVSNDLWVTANFKETQLTHMHANQHVRIRVDAFPDATFAGHVDSFQTGSGAAFSSLPAENATGNYVKVVQRIPVKILFDDPQQRDQYRLAPGLSVTPRVTVR